jgi:cell division inhibitor SulA
MGAVVRLNTLFHQRQVWTGHAAPWDGKRQSTGYTALDSRLPTAGWPDAALTELLIAHDGIGEVRLLWPTLARLSQDGQRVVLVAPPYLPFAPSWQSAGMALPQLQVLDVASPRDALWASEQCLRSGSCGAVVCWPFTADDRALRRLQVAAESGGSLAFAYRPLQAAHNPSPAALRIAIDARPAQLRVLKCRGGLPPAQPIPLAQG